MLSKVVHASCLCQITYPLFQISYPCLLAESYIGCIFSQNLNRPHQKNHQSSNAFWQATKRISKNMSRTRIHLNSYFPQQLFQPLYSTLALYHRLYSCNIGQLIIFLDPFYKFYDFFSLIVSTNRYSYRRIYPILINPHRQQHM